MEISSRTNVINHLSDIYIKLPNLHDWEDYDGVNLKSECLSNMSAFFLSIAEVKVQDFLNAKNIYLVEDRESYDLSNFVHPRFIVLKRIVDFFKYLKVENKLIFLTNSVYFRDVEINNIPHKTILTFFLQSTSPGNREELKEIRRNAYKYKFLFQNRKIRRHRKEIYNFLKEREILAETLYSYDCYTNTENTLGGSWSVREIPEDGFKNCLINLVSETSFYINNFTGNTCFVTEKTDKCLSHMMPFIVIGRPKTLVVLRRLGFKTFNQVWNEDYDNCRDDNRRLEMIKELILDISSWTDHQVSKAISNLIQITEYNYLHYQKLKEQRLNLNTYGFITGQDKESDTYTFALYDELVKLGNNK